MARSNYSVDGFNMDIEQEMGGQFTLIVLFSCAWGFLAGMIGYGLFGWAWALLLGILALISGVKIHCRDLRRPFVSRTIEQFNANKWRQNWHLGPQNLN